MALLIAFASEQITSRTALAQPASRERPGAPDQDDDVVRVNTELVVLNATVLDKNGKFVPGLKRTDFQIFEDGAEQKLVGFTTEETPFASMIFAGHFSGSMETRLTLGWIGSDSL